MNNFNKNNYEIFILSLQYRVHSYHLTLWDLEFIVKNIIDSYKLPYVNNNTYVKLQDMFIDTYLEPSGIGSWAIKINCQTIGLKALDMLKDDSQWLEYDCPAKYLDLFVRCLCFDYKRSTKVKRLLRGGV